MTEDAAKELDISAEGKVVAAPTDPIMRWFECAHLPEPLQGVSREFTRLAEFIASELPRCAERTVALRKLLEAKDAAVRAKLV